jgi:hypothetical protein
VVRNLCPCRSDDVADVAVGVDPSPVRKRKSWNYDTGSITESPTKRVKAENVIAGPSGTHADENEDEQQAAKEDEKPPGKSRKGAR